MGVPVKDWLYFITDGKTKTARIVGDTPQMVGGNPVPLPENPEGWREFETGWATDTKYNSLNRSATIPMTFIGDGEKIIRYAMLKGLGFNSNLYLAILHKQHTTGIFKVEYFGKLDISKAKNSPLQGIAVNAVQGGPISFITANESIAYEFDQTATNLNTKKVMFDGMSFLEKYHFIYGESIMAGGSELDMSRDFITVFPFVFSSNDGYSFDTVKGDSIVADSIALSPPDDITAYVANSANYFMYRPYATSIKIRGQILLNLRSIASPMHVDLYLYTTLGNRYDIAVNQYIDTNAIIFTFPVSFDITLAPNEKIFPFIRRYESGVANFQMSVFEGTEITFEFKTKNQPSVHRGFEPLYLWQQLVSKISNGECVGASSYFTTHKNINIFSGQSLRNLSKAVLKSSFSDFFTFFDSIRPMGLKIDGNTIYIEPLADLYGEGADLLNLGQLSKPVLTFAFDALPNTAKFGYPHPGSQTPVSNSTTVSNNNGVPEFNGINVFSLPITVLKKEYSKVGAWIAAASEIEKLRTAVVPINSNASNNTDNEVYVANVSAAQDVNGNYLLTRLIYDVIEGVVDGTDVYNIEELSPARMARAHGPVLNALLEQQGNKPLTFQTTDLSADLVTRKGGLTISEKAPIYPGNMESAIMRMIDIEGTVAIQDTLTFNEVLTAVNKGLIRVDFLNTPIYGLPIGNFKCKPASNEPQEIKMRISTRTSLDTLYSLSLPGTFSIDALNNTIFISDLNPLHFSKFGFSPATGFHHLEIYDAQFQHRNDRYSVKPQYLQPFQKTDPLPLNFVTSGYGTLAVHTYSFGQLSTGVDKILKTVAPNAQLAAFIALLAGTVPVQTNNAALVSEPSVLMPYVLQKATIDLSVLAEDRYIHIVYDGVTPLFMSEWIDLREDWPDTFAFDYYDTQNKYNTYWGNGFRPRIRVEANFMPLEPQSDFANFVDEIKDNTPIDGRPWDKRILILGSGSGIPDWMARKLNIVLLLNRCAIEGDYWSRNGDAKLEPVKREGYPMNYYTVEVAPQKAAYGLVYTGMPAPSEDVIAYTLDMMGAGFAPGLIDIEVIDD